MTLPISGPMTAAMINAELGRASDALFNIDGADERALARVPTGPISFADFYGKLGFTPTYTTLSITIGFSAGYGVWGYDHLTTGTCSPTTYKDYRINVVGQDDSGRFLIILHEADTPTSIIDSLVVDGVELTGLDTIDDLYTKTWFTPYDARTMGVNWVEVDNGTPGTVVIKEAP